MKRLRSKPGALLSCLVLILLIGGVALPVQAQEERTENEQTQGSELVSFRPDTPFRQFIQLLNPIFEREQGKQIVDPKGRTMPIGIPISGRHYRDAFERVLRRNNLTYRETETVFLIEEASESEVTSSSRSTNVAPRDTSGEPATLSTREIRISAILFDVNLSKIRDIGLNWSQLLGTRGSGQGGRNGQRGRTGRDRGEQFYVNTENLFRSLDVLDAPSQIGLGRLIEFFRILEQEEAGTTIANPQVTVQSGEKGQIQIGQDIPVQTQDFSGNTVTQFFSTGIIVDVTPTLITRPVADTAGAPEMEFIHLDVRVEDSNTSPSASGPIINRNQATTQVLLLDKEATAIGGLITTQETTSRSGVPGLKDLPPWVFGLRYIFGREETSTIRRELMIVLRAEVVDPLRVRAQERRDQELLYEQRQRGRDALDQLGGKYRDSEKFPAPDSSGWDE